VFTRSEFAPARESIGLKLLVHCRGYIAWERAQPWLRRGPVLAPTRIIFEDREPLVDTASILKVCNCCDALCKDGLRYRIPCIGCKYRPVSGMTQPRARWGVSMAWPRAINIILVFEQSGLANRRYGGHAFARHKPGRTRPGRQIRS
jgi:hypothetical protein